MTSASPAVTNKTQLWTAVGITAISGALLAIHISAPTVVSLDSGTLAVLALAAAPWLTIFFKSLKIPGLAEIESREFTQGESGKPESPAARIKRLDSQLERELSESAKRILGTLWRFQRQLFADDKEKCWTFGVNRPRRSIGIT
jgi:hypothetical protein